MAGVVTGLGTTYDLPNFTGILYGLTPADTPFFSAIGGLSDGGQTDSTQFQWSSYDLRDPGQNVALEGQDAPDPEERVRDFESNVTQIHHEAVGVSYTKIAAIGNMAGLNVAGQQNNVVNELDWQVVQMLKQMVRDVEVSFLTGTYQLPTDNTTPRKTRGILEAIDTNVATGGTPAAAGATVTAATNEIGSAGHGLDDGDQVQFSAITGAAPLTTGRNYYVRDADADSFTVSLTPGGGAVNITADGTVDVAQSGEVTKDSLDALMQEVYDNGGILESETATLIVPSAQKPKVTKAYITDQKYAESSRTVGGVSVQTILTDFGTLNVMLDRHMPRDTIAVVSLEECAPVYLEIPGKGHFFAEPLAKTGANEKVQLYGETGLLYGNRAKHGKITGLAA